VRSLRMLNAMMGFALLGAHIAAPSPVDTRAPSPREREPRLAPTHYGTGRRVEASGYVSRQQRRAALRAQHFAAVSAKFPRMPRDARRRVAIGAARHGEV